LHSVNYLPSVNVEYRYVFRLSAPLKRVREIIRVCWRINQWCGAIIAVCTADDEESCEVYQLRQDVLLEIDIEIDLALGLNRGLQRLTILQQFGERVSEAFTKLEDRL
jgi:hypothetical protein